MHSGDLTTLVHLVGFLTGIALYAMLGVMTLRASGGVASGRLRGGADRIPVATAMLGLVWNSGALLIYTLRDFGISEPAPWAVALAYAALGFLPAVVVHSAAQALPARGGPRRLVAAAYALSTAAAALQLHAAVSLRVAPSRPALLTLTIGYSAVVAVLAVYMRRQPGWRPALSVVALAAFAVMALHLRQHAAGPGSWPAELAGHHASLPLALAILYQDYRFALADLFLKRVLVLIGLVTIAFALYVGVAVPLAVSGTASDPLDPHATAALLALWTATALAYPFLRRGVDRLVDRVILRRIDYRRLRADIEERVVPLETPEQVLDAVCAALAPALTAGHARWAAVAPSDARQPRPPQLLLHNRDGRHGATVYVPTAEAPSFVIEVADLAGGRRLLSDDLAMLESIALIAARRVDAVRVAHERCRHAVRENEILQLATEAELRALRAQLNPHFLFNALTTVGHLIQEAPSRALDTLYRLTGLLRVVLRRSDGEFTTLGEELELAESYLAIEQARFEERLGVTLDVAPELAALRIPPLLLQPLVENAVKHGIAPRRAGGRVGVSARLEGPPPETLCLSVTDTGVGVSPAELRRRRGAGVGLSNIERRLERHFGPAATLAVRSAVGVGTTVEIRLPATRGWRSASAEPAGAAAAR